MTMMQHSLRKEAEEMLCDAIESRIKDGEAPHDQWIDTQGTELPPNRLSPIILEDEISTCDNQDIGLLKLTTCNNRDDLE